MARKPKTKTTRPRTKPDGARIRRAFDAVTTAMSCLLLVSIIAGLVLGRGYLVRQAAKLRTAPAQVKFNWPPLAVPPGGVMHEAVDGVPNTWLDVKSRRDMENIAASLLSDNPFDADSLRDAQAALMATGWFERPCTLTRDPSGVVEITGVWRVPVAAVRFGDHDYVVASRGERLPATYEPDGSGLRVVIGPDKAPPTLGESWLGGDVQAGLALLDFLRSMPGYNQVAAVDISEFTSRKRLVIVTDRGSQIVWGGPPGEFHAGQARDELKRTRITRLYRESGRIDHGQDIVNVSLASGY